MVYHRFFLDLFEISDCCLYCIIIVCMELQNLLANYCHRCRRIMREIAKDITKTHLEGISFRIILPSYLKKNGLTKKPGKLKKTKFKDPIVRFLARCAVPLLTLTFYFGFFY